MADLLQAIALDAESARPLYRQLADSVSQLIENGAIQAGDRLPPTRELASQLGLNRTTVAAAYSTLEEAGLIRGHVGRGSFVAERPRTAETSDRPAVQGPGIQISFSNSRPASDAFPLAEFRHFAKQVIDSSEAGSILQLGPTHGYGPLRRFLLSDAIECGIARPSDDLIITNGCQQALDLLARVFLSAGTAAVIEDPVYHGLIRAFSRCDAELLPVPVDAHGLDINALETTLIRYRPKLLVVTPSFQNPTGATLPLDRRRRIVELARQHGALLVENDIYTELRYSGQPLDTLKQLDDSGNTILLRSYSKILFPGLRVGWAIGPRPLIARLADAKQISDLHSDQLSQAVLLRFTESGELARHIDRTRISGAQKLAAAVAACGRYLPPGASFTTPEGGMNLWIELPAPLNAEFLLARTQERGVDFLPGQNFSARRNHSNGLRLSFSGLPIEEIERGIEIIGACVERELQSSHSAIANEPAAVLV
ncbi:MAG TPA: PLP-dependent aminotransferase family protein [Bryobacteraceae bacterium]|nr:PLP-dependent aminotransferase family protein [Bryobacteraceae bacterium]